MNRILATEGAGNFFETTYDVSEPADNEIQVQAVMTGVCRSDIEMMQGNFGPLPLNMQGHEGLGKVIKKGSSVRDVDVGDYVATRGEPAYADVYNVRDNEYVRVPSAEPKYILEPVACGINVVQQSINEVYKRSGEGRRLLILGSGFLAWVAYHTILLNRLDFDITVIGKSNQDLWKEKLSDSYRGDFDVIIDLSNSTDVFDKQIVRNEALVIFGNQKTVTTDFGNLLWKACTMVFPSPRTEKFYDCMKDAAIWIENEDLDVDYFWTRGYNRNTEWQQAFEQSLNRTDNFSRAYIYWEQDA